MIIPARSYADVSSRNRVRATSGTRAECADLGVRIAAGARLLYRLRGFLHEAVVPGLGGVDLGVGDLLVELAQEIERTRLAVCADDTIPGVGIEGGLHRGGIERLV